MSQIKPRLAVGYHSVQSPENNAAIMDGVRKTYDGPLALARDLMVINVTKEQIKVRMANVDEYVLPPNVTMAYKKAPRTNKKQVSAKVAAGKWKGYTPPPMPKKEGDHLKREASVYRGFFMSIADNLLKASPL